MERLLGPLQRKIGEDLDGWLSGRRLIGESFWWAEAGQGITGAMCRAEAEAT